MGCTCTIDDYDGYDDDEYYADRISLANRNYRCCECDEIIKAGENHRFTCGKTDEKYWTERTCAVCLEIRNCFFCSYYFRQMFERLRDEVDELNLSGLEMLSPAARDKFFSKVEV